MPKFEGTTPEKSGPAATGDQATLPATTGQDTPPPVEDRSAPTPARHRWEAPLICILLAALVLAVFGQTISFEFINRDDPDYVYQNPVVLKGITLSNIEWAFTHPVSGH